VLAFLFFSQHYFVCIFHCGISIKGSEAASAGDYVHQ